MKSDRRTDVALLILRVGIGLIAIYYGCQKTLGIFGGGGVQGTISYMRDAYGFPSVFAILAMCGELLGGLGMVFGFLTSVAAFGFACVMAVATFENWKSPGLLQTVFTKGDPGSASQAFFSLALLVGAVAIMILGAGEFSLDNRFFRKKASS